MKRITAAILISVLIIASCTNSTVQVSHPAKQIKNINSKNMTMEKDYTASILVDKAPETAFNGI
jgi:outer membrane murein-binding lipoprotein Lpp